jgi:hypothetical protein
MEFIGRLNWCGLMAKFALDSVPCLFAVAISLFLSYISICMIT